MTKAPVLMLPIPLAAEEIKDGGKRHWYWKNGIQFEYAANARVHDTMIFSPIGVDAAPSAGQDPDPKNKCCSKEPGHDAMKAKQGDSLIPRLSLLTATLLMILGCAKQALPPERMPVTRLDEVPSVVLPEVELQNIPPPRINVLKSDLYYQVMLGPTLRERLDIYNAKLTQFQERLDTAFKQIRSMPSKEADKELDRLESIVYEFEAVMELLSNQMEEEILPSTVH